MTASKGQINVAIKIVFEPLELESASSLESPPSLDFALSHATSDSTKRGALDALAGIFFSLALRPVRCDGRMACVAAMRFGALSAPGPGLMTHAGKWLTLFF